MRSHALSAHRSTRCISVHFVSLNGVDCGDGVIFLFILYRFLVTSYPVLLYVAQDDGGLGVTHFTTSGLWRCVTDFRIATSIIARQLTLGL